MWCSSNSCRSHQCSVRVFIILQMRYKLNVNNRLVFVFFFHSRHFDWSEKKNTGMTRINDGSVLCYSCLTGSHDSQHIPQQLSTFTPSLHVLPTTVLWPNVLGKTKKDLRNYYFYYYYLKVILTMFLIKTYCKTKDAPASTHVSWHITICRSV